MTDEILVDGYQSYTDAEELDFDENSDSEFPTTPVSIAFTWALGC
ncbi:LxmA leader domain family RiPP [Micromonospora echinofusca]|nr:LxmA leader domain family RiPP [Micromonospora echinofusca]